MALKGLSVLGAVSSFSNFVSTTKETVDDAVAIKEFIANYNSKKDEEFQAKNPVPKANEPDIKQIFYFFERGTSLTVELVGEVGRFAQDRLKEKNS